MTAPTKIPPPGSFDAVQLGCRCSRFVNQHGRGFGDGVTVRSYVVAPDCAVHADVDRNPDAVVVPAPRVVALPPGPQPRRCRACTAPLGKGARPRQRFCGACMQVRINASRRMAERRQRTGGKLDPRLCGVCQTPVPYPGNGKPRYYCDAHRDPKKGGRAA